MKCTQCDRTVCVGGWECISRRATNLFTDWTAKDIAFMGSIVVVGLFGLAIL